MSKPFQRSNMMQIARQTGVSIATVSRALNNNGAVKPETREKILLAAQRLGYSGDFEESMEMQHPPCNTIALVLPELRDEFYSNLITSIDQEARRYNYYLAVSSSQSRSKDICTLLQSFAEHKLRGVLLMAPQLATELKNILESYPLPLVLLNSGVDFKLPSFLLNNYQGAYAMVEHLVQHGYQRIGIIRGPHGNYDAERRYEGYRAALSAHGLPVLPEFDITGDFTHEGGYYAFSRMLSLGKRPDAVFISNDMMAVGALEAAKRMNVEVPREIAIGSFDDILMSRFIQPSLTTVHASVDELGRRALFYLLQIIEGKTPPAQSYSEELTSGLIIRRSCGCLPSPSFT